MPQSSDSIAPLSIVHGRRIALGRRLAIATRGDWKRLIRQHGGHPIDQVDELTDVLLISGDDDGEVRPRQDSDRHDLEVLMEDELWQLLKSPESSVDLSRFYTPQMLAKLLEVPVATIRRWHRRGLITPVEQINKLPYFDFQEIATARRIARWIQNGQSPSAIERQLATIAQASGDHRPLSQLSIIVEGQKVLLKEGAGLATANGQLHFNFEEDLESQSLDAAPARLKITAASEMLDMPEDDFFVDAEEEESSSPNILPFGQFDNFANSDFEKSPDQFIQWATELEDDGDAVAAVEVYRTMALAHGISPDINFRIAELLYQVGDLSAARERYYSAVELDETYVEARASLGCVLVDLGQNDLAVAAFRGALEFHCNFADVHFHLARLLDDMGRTEDATSHWEAFLALAPKSPWAEEARQRMRALKRADNVSN